MVGSTALLLLLGQTAQGPVSLNRVFAKGEKLSYEVKTNLQNEVRYSGLETWIPQDRDLHYRFTAEILKLEADGIAQMRYLRPTVTEVHGETFDNGPTTKVHKTNDDVLITISPINELLDLKVNKAAKKAGWIRPIGMQNPQQIFERFAGSLQSLAMFSGSLEASLDFSPKLPLDDVKVGDSWQRTVSYQPQLAAGKDSRYEVQRLDFTYTYKGIVTSRDQKVHRVTATLALNTDLARYMNQFKGQSSGLRSLPMRLNASIDYDLDLKTRKTLYGVGTTNGGYEMHTPDQPNLPIIEVRFKSRSTIRIVPSAPPPTKAKP